MFALPCADRAFAGVLCMRLLQHLPSSAQRVECLRELRRVCRGPVLVSFFDAISLQHARRVVRARLGRRSKRHAIRPRTLAAELRAAGLELVAQAPLRRFLSEQRIVLARRSGPA